MKKCIALLLTYISVTEIYCQDTLINDFHLSIKSLKEINGNFIIKATDVENKFTDTITLISFRDSIYINGQLKNRIDPEYGNLQKLTKGNDYFFTLFTPITHKYTKYDSVRKFEYSNYFIVSGKDTIWHGSDLKNIPYGIVNGLSDTIQYVNPILPIIDGVPKPIIVLNNKIITKTKVNSPKSPTPKN